jgi:hypothetical protein
VGKPFGVAAPLRVALVALTGCAAWVSAKAFGKVNAAKFAVPAPTATTFSKVVGTEEEPQTNTVLSSHKAILLFSQTAIATTLLAMILVVVPHETTVPSAFRVTERP